MEPNSDLLNKFTEKTREYLKKKEDLTNILAKFDENKEFDKDLSDKIHKIEDLKIKTEILSYATFRVLEGCFEFKSNSIEIDEETINKNQNKLKEILKYNENNEDTATNIIDGIIGFIKRNHEDINKEHLEKELKNVLKEILSDQIKSSIDPIKNSVPIGSKNSGVNKNIAPIGGKSNDTNKNIAPIGNTHKEEIDEEKENHEETNQKKKKKNKKNKDTDKDKKEKTTTSGNEKNMDTEKESNKINEAVKRISDLSIGCIYFALGTICPIFYLFSCFHLLNATIGPKEMGEYLNNKNPIIKCLTRISATPELLFTSTKRLFQEGKSKEGMNILGSFFTGENINYDHNKGFSKKIVKEILDKTVENSKNKDKKEDKNDFMNNFLSENMPQENNVSQKNDIDEKLNDLKERVNDGDISNEDIDKLNNFCEEHGKELTEEQSKQFNECLSTATNEVGNSLQDMQSSNMMNSLSGSSINKVDNQSIISNNRKSFKKDEENKQNNLNTKDNIPTIQC